MRLLIHTSLNALLLPVGEQAHAVAAGFDGIKVLFQLAEGKVFIHVLPHHETWAEYRA